MDKGILINQFLELFPEFHDCYIEHLDLYQEFLGHVFFGDEVSTYVEGLLRENDDTEQIEKFFNFLNGWQLKRAFILYKCYLLQFCMI
ncbi:DUF7674 family protein [Paenibacillus sp. FSL R5-0473]|uniref:DUF7674 family protein n=1 Tax=Paenibacillus sp. FSL R5-0473 TaxID=2921642 RepID=UPI0030F99995